MGELTGTACGEGQVGVLLMRGMGSEISSGV